MGLVAGLFGFPLAPVRVVGWLASRIQEEAEQQYYDPARIRAELEAVDEARRSGRLSEEECAALEDDLLARLMAGRGSTD